MADEIKVKMIRHGVTIFVPSQDVAEKQTIGFEVVTESTTAPIAQSVQEEAPLPELAPAPKGKGK